MPLQALARSMHRMRESSASIGECVRPFRDGTRKSAVPECHLRGAVGDISLVSISEKSGSGYFECGIDFVGEFTDAEIGMLARPETNDMPSVPGIEGDHAIARPAAGEGSTSGFLHSFSLQRSLVS